MGWTNNQTDSLTLPPGAGPKDPRIVVGPDVPAELAAHYTGRGIPVVAAILHYTGSDTYYYDATLDLTVNPHWGSHGHARGSVDKGVIHEYEFLSVDTNGRYEGRYSHQVPTHIRYGVFDREPDEAQEYFMLASSIPLIVYGSSAFHRGILITPPASSSARAIAFNHGYEIYADSAGAGSAGNRLWMNTPGGGEVVIGPRTGTIYIDSLRLRTNATTATAANAFLDPSSQQLRRSTSSRKYKQDIEPARIDLDKLRQLRPVRFRDRTEVEERGEDARYHVGLVAEEVHELGLSEFVLYDDKGQPDSIQYDRIIVGLLQWIAELETRIQEAR